MPWALWVLADAGIVFLLAVTVISQSFKILIQEQSEVGSMGALLF